MLTGELRSNQQSFKGRALHRSAGIFGALKKQLLEITGQVRRSFVPSSGPGILRQTLFSVGFTTIVCGFMFSVHTTGTITTPILSGLHHRYARI